jgi:hypothetical protein
LPQGVTELSVDLNVRSHSAEVSRRWTYQKTEIRSSKEAASVPPAVAEAVRRNVNRAVNGVLMRVIADHLHNRIEQQARQSQQNRIQQTVQIRQRAANQIQLLARMRTGGAR